MMDWLIAYSLNDVRRRYDLKRDVSGRIAVVEEDKDQFGSKYILFPNQLMATGLARFSANPNHPPQTKISNARWKQQQASLGAANNLNSPWSAYIFTLTMTK